MANSGSCRRLGKPLLRKDAIIENWKRAENLEPLERIEGLDND